MTEQKEAYMIVYEHPGDYCHLPHVFYYEDPDAAIAAMANFSSGGDVLVVRSFILAQREVAQYPGVSSPES